MSVSPGTNAAVIFRWCALPLGLRGRRCVLLGRHTARRLLAAPPGHRCPLSFSQPGQDQRGRYFRLYCPQQGRARPPGDTGQPCRTLCMGVAASLWVPRSPWLSCARCRACPSSRPLAGPDCLNRTEPCDAWRDRPGFQLTNQKQVPRDGECAPSAHHHRPLFHTKPALHTTEWVHHCRP